MKTTLHNAHQSSTLQRVFLFIILFAVAQDSLGQNQKLSEWKTVVQLNKKDTRTLIALDSLRILYGAFQSDSGIYYLNKMNELAEALNDKKYIARVLFLKGENNFTTGKTSDALKQQYHALQLAEELNDTALISRMYSAIGNSHKEYGDYRKALFFYQKAVTTGLTSKDQISIEIAYLNLGYAYSKINQLDSALYFEQLAYSLDFNNERSTLLPIIEVYLGNIQYQLRNHAIAKEYYQSALNRLLNWRTASLGNRFLVWAYLGLGNCAKTLQSADVAIAYARTAGQISEKINYLKGNRDTYALLSELFDSKQQIDSAYQYQKKYFATNDSLTNRDKYSAIESLTFEQNLKEQERQTELQKQKEERNRDLQLVITAIVILSSIILFLLISRSILVNHKVVEFLNVVVLLVVFEFINLLIHPFLESVTHHSPIFMLLALVAIAAMIVPLHHRLEHWTSKKLVEKNKAIRLAKAKKTIVELENVKA
jgi:hypothetical protein